LFEPDLGRGVIWISGEIARLFWIVGNLVDIKIVLS
jgi:hypothetical protein